MSSYYHDISRCSFIQTYGNKLNEHKAHLEVPDHKKSSLGYNHYLEAIEGNFELRTEKKIKFYMKFHRN